MRGHSEVQYIMVLYIVALRHTRVQLHSLHMIEGRVASVDHKMRNIETDWKHFPSEERRNGGDMGT